MSLREILKEEFRVKQCFCPGCLSNLEAALGPQRPRPGDYSVCGYCALILRFNEDLTVRRLSREGEGMVNRFSLIGKKKPKPAPAPRVCPKSINLSLTPEQAETLMIVCHHIGGDPVGRRGDMNSIGDQLFALGVKQSTGRHDIDPDFGHPSIYFKRERTPLG